MASLMYSGNSPLLGMSGAHPPYLPGVATSASKNLLNNPPSHSSGTQPAMRSRLKIRLGPPAPTPPPFYLMSPQPVQPEDCASAPETPATNVPVTGRTNLIQHEGLRDSHYKFCSSSKKLPTDLSGFLVGIAADVNLPATEDGGSLRSLLERPPIHREITPLPASQAEVAFRLHSGRLPPKYLELFTASSVSTSTDGPGERATPDPDSEGHLTGTDGVGDLQVQKQMLSLAGNLHRKRYKRRRDVLQENYSAASFSDQPSLPPASSHSTGLPHVASASVLSQSGLTSNSGWLANNGPITGAAPLPTLRPVSTPLSSNNAPTTTTPLGHLTSYPSAGPPSVALSTNTNYDANRYSVDDDEKQKKKKKKEKRKRRDKE